MNTERLLTLATYLETLPEALWYFPDVVKEVNVCGTVGCALGHCATLWPESWRIIKVEDWYDLEALDGSEVVDDNEFDIFIETFFGVDEEFVDKVFYSVGTGKMLREITKEMVATEIRTRVAEHLESLDG